MDSFFDFDCFPQRSATATSDEPSFLAGMDPLPLLIDAVTASSGVDAAAVSRVLSSLNHLVVGGEMITSLDMLNAPPDALWPYEVDPLLPAAQSGHAGDYGDDDDSKVTCIWQRDVGHEIEDGGIGATLSPVSVVLDVDNHLVDSAMKVEPMQCERVGDEKKKHLLTRLELSGYETLPPMEEDFCSTNASNDGGSKDSADENRRVTRSATRSTRRDSRGASTLPTPPPASPPPSLSPIDASLEEATSHILLLQPNPSTQRFHCPHPDCKFSAVRRYNVKLHYVTHLGVVGYRFGCCVCEKGFRRRHDRERHESSVHGLDRRCSDGEEMDSEELGKAEVACHERKKRFSKRLAVRSPY